MHMVYFMYGLFFAPPPHSLTCRLINYEDKSYFTHMLHDLLRTKFEIRQEYEEMFEAGMGIMFGAAGFSGVRVHDVALPCDWCTPSASTLLCLLWPSLPSPHLPALPYPALP